MTPVTRTRRPRRGRPIAVLGWLFRPLATLGGYQWYMNHQHRFHTLVTHVRGPSIRSPSVDLRSPRPSRSASAPGGNIPVYFEAWSYAGTLTISATTDPDHFPHLGRLIVGLHAERDLITGAPTDGRPAS